MLCRSLLLHLDRSGYIKLPPIKFRPNNPLANRKKPKKITVDTSPISEIPHHETIKMRQVRRTADEDLYNSLIDQYHYLGYVYPIGEYLKYIFFIGDRPMGCMAFSSAVRHIKCRDQFIGWSKEKRASNLQLIAYNTRFVILPWVSIYCLASQLLSRMAKTISADWMRYYHHPVYYLETFVDTQRFLGQLLQSIELDLSGQHHRSGQKRSHPSTESFHQSGVGLSASKQFSGVITTMSTRLICPECVKKQSEIRLWWRRNLSFTRES